LKEKVSRAFIPAFEAGTLHEGIPIVGLNGLMQLILLGLRTHGQGRLGMSMGLSELLLLNVREHLPS